MLLTDARRSARVSSQDALVPLAQQDRQLWDAALIAEGHALVRERLASGVAPGRYQLLAAINAVHTDGDATDWTQVVALYDQLVRLDGSPIVRLNRAIAVSEHDGAEEGLVLIDELGSDLAEYHAYHAARANCCGGWVVMRHPARRTTPRSSSLATQPRSRTSARRRDEAGPE